MFAKTVQRKLYQVNRERESGILPVENLLTWEEVRDPNVYDGPIA
jgi:hypothetical protein